MRANDVFHLNVGFIVSKKTMFLKRGFYFQAKYPRSQNVNNPRSTHHICGFLIPTIDIPGYEMNQKKHVLRMWV